MRSLQVPKTPWLKYQNGDTGTVATLQICIQKTSGSKFSWAARHPY
jgi:hypothetical protein